MFNYKKQQRECNYTIWNVLHPILWQELEPKARLLLKSHCRKASWEMPESSRGRLRTINISKEGVLIPHPSSHHSGRRKKTLFFCIWIFFKLINEIPLFAFHCYLYIHLGRICLLFNTYVLIQYICIEYVCKLNSRVCLMLLNTWAIPM